MVNPKFSPFLTLLPAHLSMVHKYNKKHTTLHVWCIYIFWSLSTIRQNDLATVVLVTIVLIKNCILLQKWRLGMRQKPAPLTACICQSHDWSIWRNFLWYGANKERKHQPNWTRLPANKTSIVSVVYTYSNIWAVTEQLWAYV